jgi:hypothetical protein
MTAGKSQACALAAVATVLLAGAALLAHPAARSGVVAAAGRASASGAASVAVVPAGLNEPSNRHRRKKVKPYTTPSGLFIQVCGGDERKR